MTTVLFKPNISKLDTVRGQYTINELKKERCLFSADLNYAKRRSGPIVNEIIHKIVDGDRGTISDCILNHNKYPIVDVRIQRLMPGMYPSIPGYHCDAVERSGYHGQPNIDALNNNAWHYCCIIGSEHYISMTQYVSQEREIQIDTRQPVWKQVHKAVANANPSCYLPSQGDIIKFNSSTIHAATPAVARGWRLFFRLSMYHEPPLNEEPSQMMAYVLSEENGW